MPNAWQRLNSLKVADCMSRPVAVVEQHRTMNEAACILLERGYTGAPVVDEYGHCIGVLTATDFMRYVSQRGASPPAAGRPNAMHSEHQAPPFFVPEAGQDGVKRQMATGLQSVTDDTPLLVAAQYLCAAHVHHLLVLDAEGRPAGMLTTLDVIAALLGVQQEETAGASGQR